MILKAEGKDKELEALEEELERQQLEEYGEYGITKEGESYYYNGELMRTLLDIREDSSFVALNMDPQGTVNIRIDRDGNGKIKTVTLMGKEELEELFGEDYENVEETAPVEDIVRMRKEEAPDRVKDIMENCEDGKWYTIESENRCFIYFNGLPRNYAFQPEFGEGEVKIEVFDFQKSSGMKMMENNSVLLAVPGDVEVVVTYNGREVSLS